MRVESEEWALREETRDQITLSKTCFHIESTYRKETRDQRPDNINRHEFQTGKACNLKTKSDF